MKQNSQSKKVVETIDGDAVSHFIKHSYQGESIFALGNGYIGMRGSFEEGLKHPIHPNKGSEPYNTVDGTYLNGFYESMTIEYPEPAYGYAKKYQTMLNVPNGKIIRVSIDGEELHLDTGELVDFTRTLDMETGILERAFTWCSPNGREVQVTVKRLVSFTHPHAAAIAFTLTPKFSGRVKIVSQLDGNVENVSVEKDPRVGCHLKGRVLHPVSQTSPKTALLHTTKESGLMLVSAVDHQLMVGGVEQAGEVTCKDKDGRKTDSACDCIDVTYDLDVSPDVLITLYKFLVYAYVSYFPAAHREQLEKTSGKDEAARQQTEAAAAAAVPLREKAEQELARVRALGFDKLAAEQYDYVSAYWKRADVSIKARDMAKDKPKDASPSAQAAANEEVKRLMQGLYFSMFHLLQAAGRDGHTNIGSKGLTGEGYEGHYFWDTEMFSAPFFQYTAPDICESLLRYRYHILKQARKRARELSHPRGAAYAWRTINGEECSAFFPAGSAQYHINADIAYAIKHYVASSGRIDYLKEQGAEIVFETARLWADLGDYVPARGNAFCIHGVTGPDEYTAMVDNNLYTNLMAKNNLAYACEVAEWLQTTDPQAYALIANRIQLKPSEITAWKKAAEAMYIPRDKETGLFAQDDGFFNRSTWHWDWGKRDDKDVLLNRFHYLVLYRHQVCKQADVVLALYLLPDTATLEEKRRNFNYYEQITTHDSSLSPCTFSIVASELGYRKRAYNWFKSTVRMDLDDGHGNVTAGVHIANMAGTWMCIVNGFAGLRLEKGSDPVNGIPHYKPYLPDEWESYSFTAVHQGQTVTVTITRDATEREQVSAVYALMSGTSIQIKHCDELITLEHGTTVLRPLN